jgi:hypothetical protein
MCIFAPSILGRRGLDVSVNINSPVQCENIERLAALSGKHNERFVQINSNIFQAIVNNGGPGHRADDSQEDRISSVAVMVAVMVAAMETATATAARGPR